MQTELHAHTGMHPEELATLTHTQADVGEVGAHTNTHTLTHTQVERKSRHREGSEFHWRLIICPTAEMLSDTERVEDGRQAGRRPLLWR